VNLTSIAANSTLAHPGYTPAASARPATPDLPAPTVDATKKVERQLKEPSPLALQQAVDASNKVLESKTSNELHFAVEKGTGIAVVKLINRQSGETILQFPSEAMLQIAKGIDQVTGALIQQKA
jgi:flagellar protein FlaG